MTTVSDVNINNFNLLSYYRFQIDGEFGLESFIQKCPSNLSGADFYALTNRARQHALKRLIQKCEQTPGLNLTEESIFLNELDFNHALQDFQPTLSEAAFKEYEKYFRNYSNNK